MRKKLVGILKEGQCAPQPLASTPLFCIKHVNPKPLSPRYFGEGAVLATSKQVKTPPPPNL